MEKELGDFESLLSRVRAGDSRAIGDFVSAYEPFIRRTIRFRLAHSELRTVADSVDVCQSVFGSFLIRFSAGEYELSSEVDLRKLLYSMAHHKFLALQRRELAEKRDRRLTVSLNALDEIADHRQSLSEHSSGHWELLCAFEKKLKADEMKLFDLRRRGKSWNDIADEVREEATVLRKRLSRAIRRIALELGIEE